MNTFNMAAPDLAGDCEDNEDNEAIRMEHFHREVESQIGDLVARVELRSPSDHARFERQNAALGRKLSSVHHGMALIRAVNSAEERISIFW